MYKIVSHVVKLDLPGSELFCPIGQVYENYKLYGAIASFYINDDAKTEALQRGFFVLERTGKVIHTECAENVLVM